MKKRVVLFFALFLSAVIVSSLVSAFDFAGAANQVIEWIQQIFGPFFEILLGVSSIDKYFFARVMLLILLYIVILSVLKRLDIFKNAPFAYILISAIVAILGTRYLGEVDFISFILVPYGAVAIAIAVFIPLLVYAFFVHFSVESSLGRRLAWGLFVVIFLGLWITRLRDKTAGEFSWVYLAGIIGTIIFFVFDGKLHEYFGLFEAAKDRRKMFDKHIAEVDAQISWYIKAGADTKETKARLKDLYERRKELVKERNRF